MRDFFYCFLLAAACLFVALFSFVPTAFAGPGFVEGRVMFHEKPLSGALVYAYAEPDRLFAKLPAAPPAISDQSGNFTLQLPVGRYYIAAKKKSAGTKEIIEPGDLYSFYGGNPVTIDPARKARVTLNMVAKPEPKPDTQSGDDKGGVDGVVTFNGQPLDGVILYVYLDPNDAFRGLGYYMSPPTGVDGAFKMKMNEGTYYIVARKRMSGELAGPLKEGDYFGYLDINPLVVHKGKIMHVELPVVRKVERASPGGQGRTLVSGVITDKDGKPLPGMRACLYKNGGMTDRPAIVSKPTGPDGAFEVELPLGGTYYLGARSKIGGPVEPGQFWGRYMGSPDHKIQVDTGRTLSGLDIRVERVEE